MHNPVLVEILEWSKERPGWQRDALRRLFVATAISSQDVADLTNMCKGAHGLADPRNAQALAAKHLAVKSGAASAISLVSVTHHRGVNALAPEQTVTFGPNLTIVYGPNAAGKSGYIRILKQACHSRQIEEILGDVLHEEAPLKPRATIRFKQGEAETALAWEPDSVVSDSLAGVDVFDSRCAPVYLRDKTDVAFRPFGLDVFDKLSVVCGEVRERLDAEYAALCAAVPAFPVFPPGTRARSVVDALTSLTKVDEIRVLATLSKNERHRLKELQEQQRDLRATDPRQRANELKQKADRIDLLVRHLGQLASTMDGSTAARLQKALESMGAARDAVVLLRKTTLTPDLLAGTGEEAWRTMWAAAEEFSSLAYPDTSFPDIRKEAKCPFCQQPIGSDARKRLEHFAEYVSSEAQGLLSRAARVYSDAVASVTQIRVEREDAQLALNELSSEDEELAERIGGFIEKAKHFQRDVTKAKLLRELPIEGIGMSPDSELRLSAKTLRERVVQLQAQSSTMEPKAAAELLELQSRVSLAENLPIVEGEIERKKRLAAYKLCLEDVSTSSITRKSTELTKRLITDQLREAFQEELTKIDFKHLAVEIQSVGGSKGTLYHRLVFANAPGIILTNVLSEGESRALSLAAFLTELSTAATKSAVIFDDPVSSLDHIWRERIARRLVGEAASRQVIVFTHDILFLRFLLDECEQQGVSCHHQYVKRDGHAGISSPDLPWIAMKTKDRIGALRKRWQAAEKVYRTAGADAYEKEGREIYGFLREAWEQAVSEILLNDVVERYRHSIETHRVKKLHDISQQDCATVDKEMAECSRWIRGHDHAPADGTPFPRPAEVSKRIDELEQWVTGIRKRRDKK
jgi:ABC-type cobalamin/Fe3+-siderophores transport system ATPase subunit